MKPDTSYFFFWNLPKKENKIEKTIWKKIWNKTDYKSCSSTCKLCGQWKCKKKNQSSYFRCSTKLSHQFVVKICFNMNGVVSVCSVAPRIPNRWIQNRFISKGIQWIRVKYRQNRKTFRFRNNIYVYAWKFFVCSSSSIMPKVIHELKQNNNNPMRSISISSNVPIITVEIAHRIWMSLNLSEILYCLKFVYVCVHLHRKKRNSTH